jgi:hypothetical protein
MDRKISKSVWVEAGELKFGINIASSNLKLHTQISVCVEAGELKFCMNLLYYECFKA